MDLTPAFFDRWREHRELDYMDRVREVFEQAVFDQPWLEEARLRTLATEARATLHHAGIEVDEEAVKAVVDRGESDAGLDPAHLAAARGYGAALRAAMTAAAQQAAVTPALLDNLHALICGGVHADVPGGDGGAGASLQELCDWLAAPPAGLHPVVVAALAHLEVLRARRWSDGNGRVARLLLLLLLTRSGYGYQGLLAPSAHWRDPRSLPDPPAQELQPDKAETHPAVEHVVHAAALALRDTVSWARAEEGGGSLQALLFGLPLQP